MRFSLQLHAQLPLAAYPRLAVQAEAYGFVDVRVHDLLLRRLGWAALLRRVFALDLLTCARCGGPRRIVGAGTEPHAVRRLLAALGLAAEPPPGIPLGTRS